MSEEQTICGYKPCQKLVLPPKLKFCCDSHGSQEKVRIISELTQLKPNTKQLRPPVEVAYHVPVRKYIHDIFTDSDKWTQIGLSSSVEAMQDVIKMLK